MGHISINCPNSKGWVRKGKYKRHQAHSAEDDEHDHEKTKEEESSEEYFFYLSSYGYNHSCK
jgi:hypothetical protein